MRKDPAVAFLATIVCIALSESRGVPTSIFEFLSQAILIGYGFYWWFQFYQRVSDDKTSKDSPRS